jgi:hypothetical protein
MKTILTRAIFITHACILVMIAWQFTGCFGFDDVVAPVPEDGRYPFPETPDQLMANFAVAYAQRDLDGYAATLHPDFEFVPAGAGADRAAYYSRETELRVARNMFSGQDREKDGVFIAGISSIRFERCEPLGTWQAEGGALRRTYAVRLRFLRDRGPELMVNGQCDFTVIAVDLPTADGGKQRGYQILRQVDHTD